MRFVLIMNTPSRYEHHGCIPKEIEAISQERVISIALEEIISYEASVEHVSEAVLYEIQGEKISVPLDEYRQELERQANETRLTEKREEDYREYLRLKAMFGVI